MNSSLLVLQAFASFGVAYLLGFSKISFPLRLWLAGSDAAQAGVEKPVVPGHLGWFGRWAVLLLECPMCLGFWIGLVWGLSHGEKPEQMLVRAFATMTSNFILARALKLV